MNFRGIDSIWRTRGELSVSSSLSDHEALDRLIPLFDPSEAIIDRDAGMLTYRKANPAAQDKLATFSNGHLAITEASDGRVLRYDAGSPALLLTFLAPLLFALLALGMVGLGKLALDRAAAEERAAAAEEKKDAAKDDDEVRELHWIDRALGAPAPEKKVQKSEAEQAKEAQEDIVEDHSPRRAFGIAGLFALIYLLGRWLEPRLYRATLLRALAGPAPEDLPLGVTAENPAG